MLDKPFYNSSFHGVISSAGQDIEEESGDEVDPKKNKPFNLTPTF